MKCKYTILCGKLNYSGIGSMSIVSEHDSLKEAKKAFEIVVQTEEKRIKDWNLHHDEYIEINLVKGAKYRTIIKSINLRWSL